MNPLIYDVSMLVGLLCIAAGVWLQFGLAPALMATGALVIGLTALGASLAAKRGG